MLIHLLTKIQQNKIFRNLSKCFFSIQCYCLTQHESNKMIMTLQKFDGYERRDGFQTDSKSPFIVTTTY